MVVVGFAAAIAEAVTTFSCRVGEFVLGNPLSQSFPLSILVPQASASRQRSICGVAPPNANLPGVGILRRGGLCAVNYRIQSRISVRRSSDGLVITSTSAEQTRGGPISQVRTRKQPTVGPAGAFNLSFFVTSGNGAEVLLASFNGNDNTSRLTVESIEWLVFRRSDNLPDTCGDSPPEVFPPQVPPLPYPAPPNPTDPTVIWPPITVPIIYAPFSFSAPITINVNFGGFRLEPQFNIPITIPVDIGGIKIGDVILRPEAEPEYRPNPAPTGDESTEPPECPETSTIVVPFAIRESCSQSSAELEVLSDSLPPALVGRLIDTVNLALECCGQEPETVQEPETLLSSGTAPNPPGERFVNLPDECVSVRLRITGAGSARQVTTFGSVGQRKYGSLGFALSNMAGGGDYVYVYDNETYYPLPPRAKPGRIRLLLAPGVQWELYDTGERL